MHTGIADTSFIIDWAKYSRRDVIFRLFELIWLPEAVLAEVRSEHTIAWIAGGLASENMAIFPDLPEIRGEALKIMEVSRKYPVKSLDYPEAFCLAVGRERKVIVLSENGGAYVAQFTFLKGVKVWRAFEVLLELLKRGFVGKEDFYTYQSETLHRFPRRDMERLENGGFQGV